MYAPTYKDQIKIKASFEQALFECTNLWSKIPDIVLRWIIQRDSALIPDVLKELEDKEEDTSSIAYVKCALRSAVKIDRNSYRLDWISKEIFNIKTVICCVEDGKRMAELYWS